MAQICSFCGTSNRDAARYCQNCAASLSGGAISSGPATGLLSPQIVLSGRYLILNRVGQGGMGAVYKASDTRINGKLWAVKEMSDAAITNPLEKQESLNAFHREAELLSKLSHPHIPRVIDFFSQGGKQYLVMDFVEGETLQDTLERRNSPFSEVEVRPWTEQLCDVLAYLHRQTPPVIFRDLKPGNIMVDSAGQLKLIDFGIVRFFQPGKGKDTRILGTPGYAAPEQYGKGQTDARADIYALGATLHHLLTNHDPALTPFQFQPVHIFNPKVSATLENVVMRALEQDQTRRWQTVNEMRQALTKQTPPSLSLPSQPTPAPPLLRPVPPPPVVKVYPPAPLSPTGTEFVGFGRRLAASLIDSLVLTVSLFIIAIIVSVIVAVIEEGQQQRASDMQGVINGVMNCISLLISLSYYVLLPARSGQTFGKKVMGIRIVTLNGDSPGLGRCLLRYIGYFFSYLILCIGFLMPLWTEKKQALHDMMAGTYVVRV